MIANKKVVHIADLRAEKAYADRDPWIVAGVELGGVRTVLMVPMLKENELIGAFSVYRQEVRPFTERQIALGQNFAAQAVIAIENARLLKEVRQRTTDLTDALERQTASSEVLHVISSSPGELEPVFTAMLKNAVSICGANFGNLLLYEHDAYRMVAMHNAPEAYASLRTSTPVIRPSPENALGRIAATKELVQITDLLSDDAYKKGTPLAVSGATLAGIRTLLAVPMLKDDHLVGAIVIYRQEVRPFNDKQIALMQNFAAQAVIAIENARLLNELKQSLEQQTATAEVLQVVSSSLGDLEPVFATMLEKAVRICDATFGNIYRWDGAALHLVATHNTPPAFAEARRRSPHRRDDRNRIVTSILATKTPVHVVDAASQPGYIDRSDLAAVQSVELGCVRTLLAVPMLKEGELIGGFTVYRQEVRPFTDKQIELVQNFAAQAVIAIENARLLNELRQRTNDLGEALEQQTATSDVLQVISSSPGDLEPVFTTMLENATRICDAKFGNVYLWDGDVLRLVAAHNTPPAFAESRKRAPFRPNPSHPFRRLVVTKQVFHVPDVAALPAYKERDPQIV